MKIILEDIGKKYNAEWIFRNINFEFSSENKYVILGANGSGKSTLLQVIAGNYISSEGKISYHNPSEIEPENIFRDISFSAPYLELIEELSLKETIEFHSKFKKLKFPTEEIIKISELENSKEKQLKYFSSGMKQRVRLCLAILSDVPILLLDEPATNLDRQGIQWYQELINNFAKEKLIIVCSNQQSQEYSFCNEELVMENYK